VQAQAILDMADEGPVADWSYKVTTADGEDRWKPFELKHRRLLEAELTMNADGDNLCDLADGVHVDVKRMVVVGRWDEPPLVEAEEEEVGSVDPNYPWVKIQKLDGSVMYHSKATGGTQADPPPMWCE
jgi:hypothetical protein